MITHERLSLLDTIQRHTARPQALQKLVISANSQAKRPLAKGVRSEVIGDARQEGFSEGHGGINALLSLGKQGQKCPLGHSAERGNIARMEQDSPDTPLTRAIRAYLASSGESMRSLSLKIGSNETLVRKILNGDSKNSRGDTLTKLAQIMGVDVRTLTEELAPPSTVRDAPEVTIPGRASMPVSLPVYGTAAGGNGDGAFILSTSDVVDRVRRPSSLAENKLAYGLYVEGDSMEPQIYAGELLIVDPAKKARPRDKVVLVISYPDGEGIRSMAYVKELVRIGADKVTVRQFNPPKEIEFPKANVASLHRILTTAELFGV